MDSLPHDDVSSLAWVQEELRKSLDAAHKALRRTLKESEAAAGSDLDDVEPALLRSARQQIHQAVGVLELVGLPAGAALLRGSEAAVQRFITKPQTLNLAAVEAIERGSFALHDFLTRRLAGKQLSPVALFPQYRAVHELAGTAHIHPADLWPIEWRWQALQPEAGISPRGANAALIAEFESQVLASMRPGGDAAMRRLSDLSAGVAAGAGEAGESHAATLWQLAAGFFEAQALGLLPGDVYAKRIPSRLLAQLRQQAKGEAPPGERLARELLFLCAQAAPPEAAPSPRLATVKAQYAAAQQGPINYQEIQLGRYDPAWITQARKRVANAKDSWSAVAGGEMHRLSGLNEQFTLVSESLKRLVPGGDALGDALSRVVSGTVQKAAAPEPALAMEIATSLLYVEAALEDGAFDDPEQTPRVRRLAQRVDAVAAGAASEPLESWMEELYRRVSDRQTMGSVVQELRSALSESEKLIDQFFRAPAEPAVLIPVPGQLQAMRGVLSVLGLEQATQAVLRMRDDVDALVAAGPEARQHQPLFERLAGNLSALSFLIDLLGVQPQVVKSLFRFDAESGLLSSRLGRHSTPLEVAAASGFMPDVVDEVQHEADAASEVESTHPAVIEPATAAAPPLTAAPAPAEIASPVAHEDHDDMREVRDIFIEEAREVVGTARGALDDLHQEAAAIDLLTTVRRSFHTFKGSARMVGLNEFGEAAWACEQMYNDLLARQQPASEDFLRVSTQLLDHLAAWVEAIAEGRDATWRSRPVREVADALRLHGSVLEIHTPAPAPAAEEATPLPGFPAGLVVPAASDLDLIGASEPPASAPAEAPAGLDFVFDLGDGPLAEPSAAPVPVPALDGTIEPHELAPEPFSAVNSEPLPLPDLPDLSDFASVDGGQYPAPDAAAPPSDDAPEAQDAASVIEPLLPSAEVADIDAASAFALLHDSPESATVPFEPSELIVALQPSGAGALPPEEPPESLQPDAWPPDPLPVDPPEAPVNDQIKVVGSLQISIPLFNIFLTEADELSRRLAVELSEWSHELDRPVGETAVALAHSLGGSSATVGFIELSALSRRLEQALAHSQRLGSGTHEDAALFLEASDEVRRLLHQFAAGFLKSAAPGLLDRLSSHEIDIDARLQAAASSNDGPPTGSQGWASTDVYETSAMSPAMSPQSTDFADLGVAEFKPFVAPISEPPRAASALALDSDEDIDSVDAVDPELFPIFEEEALELLPELASHLRDWSRQPAQTMHASASMRTLHTLKGGARLAGAMRLGEMAHRLETAIEHLLPHDDDLVPDGAAIEQLLGRADGLTNTFEALRRSDAQAYGERTSGFNHLGAPLDAPAELPPMAPLPALSDEPHVPIEVPTVTDEVLPEELTQAAPAEDLVADAAQAEALAAQTPPVALPPMFDWSRFVEEEASRPVVAAAERAPLASAAAVRVRTQLLDRMVNQAGEVSIARARLESEVGTIKGSLGDLTDNLERLRGQLRDIELQAETQMATRMEAAKAAAEAFDPLEFDRFTRFQELTRMMAESVNDVATVQRTLQRTLETAEDELAAQARLTRDLQDDLLRTRMVEFEGLSERLYRVVRQTAKETGKQVRLDIVGGSIEVDRGVLDRMTGAFEHLLRNCITHGIEPSADRVAAGKEAAGSIVVALHQEGNEVSVEFRDDGMGLDLARIREKGLSSGLIAEGANTSDADLANLIFMPGFSTADKVTELAGRGVGMDVVRSEVNALGGRIETASAPGQGTSFKLVLPLTTAVTQVVMLRSGDASVAVPATLIEVVRRASAAEVEIGYQTGAYTYGDQTLPLLWLGALLQISGRSTEPTTRTTPVVVVRSAQQRIALHVDEVLGNQEVVVKNLGPQLSSLPGLAGMTLLASGAVTMIYNPVALATVYGDAARRAMAAARSVTQAQARQAVASALPTVPLVLVVDDSLTVRRVTQRLLVREGYRVVLAKDGFEALERLNEERPSVVLSDIEMPRMDGFDLLRNIRSDEKLSALPVIMITSRIAQKHRDYANELGVNHYLGKPYSEEELLSLIGRYCVQPDLVI